jgi:hypothetical protein
MNKTTAFLLLYLFFSTIVAAQQTQTVRGTVADEDTQQPIADVTVWIDSMHGKFCVTDSGGAFVLHGVPTGKQYLQVRHLAYVPKEHYELTLLSGKETVVNILLKESITHIDEVVVTPSKQGQSGVRILPAIVNRYAGNVRDPLRMLTSVAGVQNTSDDKNDLVVRGNSPIGVLWMLEGCEILNPNHFAASGTTGGTVSVLNPDMMGVSTLYTGAFPTPFGNVLSAVFDAKLRNGSAHKFEHYAQLSNVDFNVGSEGYLTKGKASYNVAYRQSFVAAIENVSQKYRDALGATPDFKDATAKLYFPHRKGSTSIWAVGGQSKVQVEAGNGVNNSTLDVANQTATLSAGIGETLFLSDKMSMKANLYTSQLRTQNVKQDHDYTGQGGLPSSIFTDCEQRYGFNATLTFKANSRNVFTAGVAGSLMSSRLVNDQRQFSEDTLFYYKLAKQYGMFNAFAEYKHRFADEVEATVGLHYFYLFLNRTQSAEPRASLSWQPSPRHNLTLYAGMYSRQNPIGIYLTQEHSIDGGFAQPYLSLGLMKSAQAVLSYRTNPVPKWNVDVNLYYQHHYNIAVNQYSPSYSALNLAYYFDDIYMQRQKLEATGIGRNYGIELSTHFGEWHGYYAQCNGSLFSAKARGYDRNWHHTAFNNTYSVTVLAGKEIQVNRKYTFTVDASATVAGGRRYTPLDLDATLAQQHLMYDEVRLNTLQYAPYRRVDIKFAWVYNARWATHIISLDFRNLFDTKNIYEQLELPLNGEVFTYTVHQLRFFPVISYKILLSV